MNTCKICGKTHRFVTYRNGDLCKKCDAICTLFNNDPVWMRQIIDYTNKFKIKGGIK